MHTYRPDIIAAALNPDAPGIGIAHCAADRLFAAIEIGRDHYCCSGNQPLRVLPVVMGQIRRVTFAGKRNGVFR